MKIKHIQQNVAYDLTAFFSEYNSFMYSELCMCVYKIMNENEIIYIVDVTCVNER